MTKKTFISTILLLVFSFVLVHNIIPHHHHDEISEINNHSLSAFGTKHPHHHDKKEQDHHNENDEPIGPFSHPTHTLASTEFTISCGQGFLRTQYINPLFLISDLVIKPTIIPIKRKPPNYISVIPVQLSFYYTHSRRGPPVLFV